MADAPQSSSSALGSTWAIFEKSLGAIGLRNPLARGPFFFALISGIILATKPSFAFNPQGYPKTFIKHTLVPWWLPGLVIAIFFSLFV